EDEDIDALVNQTTSPCITGVAGDPYPDPVYIAVEGSVLGQILDLLASAAQLPLAFIAVYYVFNKHYPLYSNVYPFLECHSNITKNAGGRSDGDSGSARLANTIL
ncbi:Hypothetical predicted protein, partial [Paramuricea clavata]